MKLCAELFGQNVNFICSSFIGLMNFDWNPKIDESKTFKKAQINHDVSTQI